MFISTAESLPGAGAPVMRGPILVQSVKSP